MIYGGKNDQAFNLYPNDASNLEKTGLQDICLFEFATMEWTSVTQAGFAPVGRWCAAMAYSEDTQQLFVFGGSSVQGGCKNEVFMCDLNPNRVRERESEFRRAIEDVQYICNCEYAMKAKPR